MLRSAIRGDRKCIFFFIASIILFLLYINLVCSFSLSDNPCQYCPGDTPKNYCLTVEDVKNCSDGSLSELNGEYELTQGDSCMWRYSGNDYISSIMLIADNWENDGGFGISVIPYTPYGDTMYFKFYPNLCTETMESDIREEHSICDSPGNPDNIYGGKATLTPCKAPEIQNLTIYPEYDSEKYTNRTNLTYEEIFPDNKLKPYINLTIIYSDGSIPGDDEQFTINYSLKFDYPEGLIVINPKIIQNTIECSKNCKIEIPEEDVKQNTLISVTANIYGTNENKTAYRYTPYFDLSRNKIRAMNVIDDSQKILVADKVFGVRVWVDIDSFVKRRNDDGTTTGFNNYIRSVNNTKVELYLDENNVFSGFRRIVNYGDIEQLKNKLSNPDNPPEVRNSAVLSLMQFKQAKDSINLQGFFPPINKEGAMSIRAVINSNKIINEYSYENNEIFSEYNLVKQLKTLKVLYVTVGFVEKLSEQVSSGAFLPSSSANEITKKIDESYNLLLESYPLNPAKVSNSNGKPVQSYMPVYLSSRQMANLKDYTVSSVGARDEAFMQLQKLGDKVGIDLVYGIVNKNALNYYKSENDKNDGIEGMFKISKSKKTVLIKESDASVDVLLHETTHRFVYTKEEPWKDFLPECYSKTNPTGSPNMYYIPSSNGWCLNQKTGEACKKDGFLFSQDRPVDANEWGINVVLFNTPDSDGCYFVYDMPKSEAQTDIIRGTVGNRKPDVMASGPYHSWISEQTYLELKKVFLGAT